MFGLAVSTLRFYDKERLLVNVKRDPSGNRKFSEEDIETLRVIEYLKKAGMQLKDIKTFMNWCSQGDITIEKRRDMFREKKKAVEIQIQELEQTLDLITFKCWYYDEAMKDGSGKRVKAISSEDMPEKIRKAFENSHSKQCACFAVKRAGTQK